MSEGRTATDFLEDEAGAPFHQALLVADVQAACERAADEFEHGEGLEEYVALCRRLEEWEPVRFGVRS
jgi:hypothetical protein